MSEDLLGEAAIRQLRLQTSIPAEMLLVTYRAYTYMFVPSLQEVSSISNLWLRVAKNFQVPGRKVC